MTITVSGTSITFNDGTTQTTAGGAPTTAQVLSATAGASVGAVGTYAFAGSTSSGTGSIGATAAGSSLRYAGLVSNSQWATGSTVSIYDVCGSFKHTGSNTALSGTWRAMGRGDVLYGATLWLRIS